MKSLAFALLAVLAVGPVAAQTVPDAPTPEAVPGGIHVSGYWTLDVRDADGTLLGSRRFPNALTASGARYLVEILTRDVAHGALSLRILSAQGACDNGSGGRSACILQEPGSLGSSPAITRDLEFVVLPANGTLPQRIRYSGSFVPSFTDNLTGVQSWFARCEYAENIACDATNAQTSDTFTTRNLGTPLSVEAGQTVDVTFELSFN